jgi:hypothetical protein
MLRTKLSFLISFALCGCFASKQERQDQNDYDRERLRIFEESLKNTVQLKIQQQTARSEENKIAFKICERDSNPGLCAQSIKLADVIVDVASVSAKTETPQMPNKTQKIYHPAWGIFGTVFNKTLDVGLAAYGISQSNKTAQIGIAANRDTLIGITSLVGQSAGTHVGDGSIYAGQDYSYFEDNSIDNSVDVGGDQNQAGRDLISGQVGDNTDTDIGRDQNIAGNDQIVGDENYNEGRINSASNEETDCVSGSTGNGAPGGNGSGTSSPGAQSTTNNSTGSVTCTKTGD